MTGVAMALACAGGAASSGGVTTPGALSWSNIFDFSPAFTNTQTITGITTPIAVGASHTGAGALQYQQNGLTSVYSGAFAVNAGDTLAWGISMGGVTKSGVITVTNVTTSTTLATITYTVYSA